MPKAPKTLWIKLSDPFVVEDIKDDIGRIARVLETDIFDQLTHPLFKAALTEVVGCLNDLVFKAKHLGVEVNNTNDMTVTEEIPNVTELIRRVRNAISHLDSPENYLGGKSKRTRLKYNVITRGPVRGIRVGGFSFESAHSDDTCFNFGSFQIYLYRHIWQAFLQAQFNITYRILAQAFPQCAAVCTPQLIPLSASLLVRDNTHQSRNIPQ